MAEGDKVIREAYSVLAESSKLLSERILTAKSLRASAGKQCVTAVASPKAKGEPELVAKTRIRLRA